MTILLADAWVAGKPRPKGSWTPIPLCTRHGDPKCKTCTLAMGTRTFMKAPETLEKWCASVAEGVGGRYRARLATDGHVVAKPYAGPVRVECQFLFAYPSKGGDSYPTDKQHGDVDKLERAVWDALVTGRVIVDDSLVVASSARKDWSPDGASAGALVAVYSIG